MVAGEPVSPWAVPQEIKWYEPTIWNLGESWHSLIRRSSVPLGGGLGQTTVVRSHLLSKPRAPRGFVPAGVSTIFALAVMTGTGHEFRNGPAGSRERLPLITPRERLPLITSTAVGFVPELGDAAYADACGAATLAAAPLAAAASLSAAPGAFGAASGPAPLAAAPCAFGAASGPAPAAPGAFAAASGPAAAALPAFPWAAGADEPAAVRAAGGYLAPVRVDGLQVLDVYPSHYRWKEPCQSRVRWELEQLREASAGQRAYRLLKLAYWPKLLEKVLRQEQFARQREHNRLRACERRTRQQHRVPAGSAAGPSGSSAGPSDSAAGPSGSSAGPSASAAGLSSSSAAAAAAASPDVIDAAAAAAEREALWQQALAEEGETEDMSDGEGMEEDLFGLPSP